MLTRPSSTTRTLLRLYKIAARGENNLGVFLKEHPEVVAALGVAIDLERDDAELALQLAPGIGRYKRRSAQAHEQERSVRAEEGARRLALRGRRQWDRIEIDPELLLGDVLADGGKQYISFELDTCRIPIPMRLLAKARTTLRIFLDLAAYLDERGLHFVWRGGRGGLNLKPQVEERGADVLLVDLRRAHARPTVRQPVLLADVLSELGLA